MARTIALLTDFGYVDNYVGIMKGVIRSISPFADIIDINHGIEPGNIVSAAYQLESSFRYFPSNSIFLCVVDPGVGSERLPVAIEAAGKFFVAPDNGLLSYILNYEQVTSSVKLDKSNYLNSNISNTFHGRDIFAPVAALISQKKELIEIGQPISINELVKFDYSAHYSDSEAIGQVIHYDNFGNLITNIKPSDDGQKKKRPKDNFCRV